MEHLIVIEKHYGINILRDDLLEGGTKSILLEGIENKFPNVTEYVYASPVYGGFQIALSAYCKKKGLKATIFCAKRTQKHPSTLKCLEYGANIIEIFPGYLSVVEKRAREYCKNNLQTHKFIFGANTSENIDIITKRAKKVFEKLDGEPEEIWVAIGSGTLIKGILQAVTTAKVYGVIVGAEFEFKHPNLTLLKYPKPFEKESKLQVDFPSTANYDRKALELCLLKNNKEFSLDKKVLFWNVL